MSTITSSASTTATAATTAMTDDLSTTDNSNSNPSKRTGGIAWAGSLVGSQNPNNLGYRYSTATKRYRRVGPNGEEVDDESKQQLPSNLVVTFQNRQGVLVGEQLDVPTDASVDDLTALIHTLLHASDNINDVDLSKQIPYTFYAKIRRKDANSSTSNVTKDDEVLDDVEITTTLRDFLTQHPQLSTEHVLELTYQPLAIFRVRPVTRCTDTMPGHTEAILHVSYSPDGRHLASGGGDTTVRFWHVPTSLPKFTCQGHKNHVLCTAWSPDGSRFASSDKNGVLILWDPNTGQMVGRKIQAHKQWITSMAWEPMHATAAGNACERLATASKDSTAKIWNVRTQTLLATLTGHADSIEAIKWGGEGLVYTASRDRTIKVWSVQDVQHLGKLVRTLAGHGHRVNTLALSCDYVCRTGPFDYQQSQFATPQEAHAAAVAKYQQFRATGPERLISGSDDYTLFLWHPQESKHPIKRMVGHQQAVNHIAFSPDGRYVASASFDKKVKVWNGYSGEFLITLTGHVGAVYQVAWSGDSRFLVSASKDSTAKLWEIPSGKAAKQTLPGHYDEVYALDWSPNGGSVATGSKDRTIKIWKH